MSIIDGTREFESELYLVRQIHENTERVVSGLILNIIIEIELYLVKQIPKDTEGYTWIGTDLKVFVGVGHFLHTFVSISYIHI